MTRVDFYVLPEDSGDAALFACRLAEKAYGLDHRIYILVDDAASVERLDRLLWTFRDGSFVPHDVDDGGETWQAPVLIGRDAARAAPSDLLINISRDVPAGLEHYQRVAEIVAPAARGRARERFRSYRDRGCTIETHRL